MKDIVFRHLASESARTAQVFPGMRGMTVGEAITEAIRAYLLRPEPAKSGSIRDLVPEAWPEGTERSSEEIDITVYGS